VTEVPSTGAKEFGEEHREDPLWYKDAIIYQLHVKAFFDSDNDGIGDFKGLTERLDYIKDLGVTVIWLMPFYPSPSTLTTAPPATSGRSCARRTLWASR
jgi:maltose alpha-D-glucosyltransferase / alpha-amylase